MCVCVCVKFRYGATFTEEECEEMFSDADKNGDGFIDFEVKYMGKLPGASEVGLGLCRTTWSSP